MIRHMISVTADDKAIEELYSIRNPRGDTLENRYNIVRYDLLSLNIDHFSTLPMIRHPEQMERLHVLDLDIVLRRICRNSYCISRKIDSKWYEVKYHRLPSSIHPHTLIRRHNCADTFKKLEKAQPLKDELKPSQSAIVDTMIDQIQHKNPGRQAKSGSGFYPHCERFSSALTLT